MKTFSDRVKELRLKVYPPGSKMSVIDWIGLELTVEEEMAKEKEKDHVENKK